MQKSGFATAGPPKKYHTCHVIKPNPMLSAMMVRIVLVMFAVVVPVLVVLAVACVMKLRPMVMTILCKSTLYRTE